MFRKLLAAAVLSTAALGAVVVPSVASAQVYIQTAPPPLRVEPVPAPRRGHVWVPGHWQWRGHRHVWVPGTWIVARRGYAYVQPRWIERDGRWYYERGRWGRGDRDHDGIPNRRDRHPNNPNRG
jgi:hypothetical protein